MSKSVCDGGAGEKKQRKTESEVVRAWITSVLNDLSER